MASDFLYMAGVVAAGFAVTIFFRALPFLLFPAKGGRIPPWIERLGATVSPLVIAALIVYSYSSLEWRTPWPYIAGAATVAVQLAVRNSLAAIVAGTAVYMSLLAAGCSSQASSLTYDHANPLLNITPNGIVFGEDEYVTPAEAVKRLESHRIPHDATIHVRVDPAFADNRALWVFHHNYLNKAGYTRVVFVHERRAEAHRKKKERGLR